MAKKKQDEEGRPNEVDDGQSKTLEAGVGLHADEGNVTGDGDKSKISRYEDPSIGSFGNRDGLGGPKGPPFNITLSRSAVRAGDETGLWAAIRNRTEAIQVERYEQFIKRVLSPERTEEAGAEVDLEGRIVKAIHAKRDDLLGASSGYGVDAYNLLKYATQAFLLLEAGIVARNLHDQSTSTERAANRIGETAEGLEANLTKYLGENIPGNCGLPYLKRIANALATDMLTDSPFCDGKVIFRFSCPSMIELIWSYWHEEGMLVQTMNAICMRFQNLRGPSERDPLANLEIDPLRPLNNLLWGYIQDDYNRLTVKRRAYEYDHHYGLKLVGKAVPEIRSADSRSKFIEAFHNLLYRTAAFYREDADTTVVADGFALLSSLREVHLILAEGAHNQFGDLPTTARAEMLIMQYILGTSGIREFLRGRAMVPYNERWMGQVDTMKKLQGWTDTSITHHRNLAVYGEQILLAVRYGDWNDAGIDQEQAKVWARYWRPEIQGYIHAYLAATGVDLSDDIIDSRGAPARYIQPSVLLESRLATQGTRGELPAARGVGPSTLSFGASTSFRRRALNPARKD